jgi:hypothetical protein
MLSFFATEERSNCPVDQIHKKKKRSNKKKPKTLRLQSVGEETESESDSEQPSQLTSWAQPNDDTAVSTAPARNVCDDVVNQLAANYDESDVLHCLEWMWNNHLRYDHVEDVERELINQV